MFCPALLQSFIIMPFLDHHKGLATGCSFSSNPSFTYKSGLDKNTLNILFYSFPSLIENYNYFSMIQSKIKKKKPIKIGNLTLSPQTLCPNLPFKCYIKCPFRNYMPCSVFELIFLKYVFWLSFSIYSCFVSA